MNLYKISRTDDYSYEDFDSAVVAAESAEDAQKMSPLGDELYCDFSPGSWNFGWTSRLEDVQVQHIGTALPGTPAGLILASYNAG